MTGGPRLALELIPKPPHPAAADLGCATLAKQESIETKLINTRGRSYAITLGAPRAPPTFTLRA